MNNDDDFDESFGWERDLGEDNSMPEEDFPEGLEEIDATDEWLMANDSVDPNDEQYSLAQDQQQIRDESQALEGSITAQEDLAIGGMTEFDAQLKRFGHVEPGIALRAANFLESPLAQDEIYAGTLGSFSEGGVNLLDTREAFGSVIGQENVGRFITELRKMATDGTTVPSVGRQHLKTAASMLGKTAADYAESGSSLYGADRNEEQRIRREAREIDAHNAAIGFAEQYVNPNMPKGPLRDKAIEDNYNFILQRALEHKTSTRAVKTETYTGVVFEEVPVMDIRGNLVLDEQGQPSYHTQSRPMVASGIMPLASEMPGIGNLPQQNEWSPRQSLFNENVYGEVASKAKYETALRNYEGMVKTLSEGSTTLSDEFRGNTRRYAGQGVSQQTDWQAKQDFLNEAMEFDLQREGGDVSHSLQYQELVGGTNLKKGESEFLSDIQQLVKTGGVGKGSSTGGMYGEKGKSQVDLYVDARDAGLNKEDANLVATKGFQIEDLLSPVSKPTEEEIDANLMRIANSNASDRVKYLSRIEAYPAAPQGSQAWKDEAIGDITGSTALHHDATDKQIEDKAQTLAKDEWGSDWGGNKYTREGSAMESTVENYLTEYLTGNLDPDLVRVNKNDSIGQGVKMRKKVIIEEAFREKIKELPGFSVSPDGYVFDEKGNSLGSAEFKYFQGKDSEKSLEKIKTEHMRQMQIQLLGNQEDGVNFFRMSDTGKFAYDFVRPNKELQNAIIETNQKALDRAEEIRRGGNVAVSHAEMKRGSASTATVYQPKSVKGEEVMTSYKGASMYDDWGKGDVTAGVEDYSSMGRGGTTHSKLEIPDAKLVGPVMPQDVKLQRLSEKAIKADKEEIAATEWSRDVKEANANATQKSAKAKKGNEDSANRLTAAFDKLAGAVGTFGKAITGVADEGIESMADIERLALETGISGEQAWGVVGAVSKEGMLKPGEVASLLRTGAAKAALFSDPMRGTGAYGDLAGSFAHAGLHLKDMSSLGAMDGLSFDKYIYEEAIKVKDDTRRKEVFAAADLDYLFIASQAGMSASAFDEVKSFNSALAKKGHTESIHTDLMLVQGSQSIVEDLSEIGITPGMIRLGKRFQENKLGTAVQVLEGIRKGDPTKIFGAPIDDRTREEIESEQARSKGFVKRNTSPVVLPTKDIGNVSSINEEEGGLVSNVNVNVEVNPGGVVTDVDNNGSMEHFSQEQDSGQD